MSEPEPTLPDIRFNPDGSITGIEGLLNQIAGALGKNLMPILRQDLIPVLQEDPHMQKRIGQAIGKQLAMPLWVLTGGVLVYLGYKAYQDDGTRAQVHRAARRVKHKVQRSYRETLLAPST